jgi:2-amino-4-hydroxy-6-hydroxymethyldihydropteridine diphosphokinase
LHERAFVLLPLAEVAPRWHHPVLGVSVSALIKALPPGQISESLEESDDG